MPKSKKNTGEAPAPIKDARFASFETDPRFRLPSKKHNKTTIDKRFAKVLKDDEFIGTTKVDKYGRKIKSDTNKKVLQRLYQEEGDEDEDEQSGEDTSNDKEDNEVDDDELVQRELRAVEENYDPARGGGFSSSESEDGSDSDSEDDDDEAGGAVLSAEGDMQKLQDERDDVEAGEVTNRIAVVNLDWDHVNSTDLMVLFSSFLGADGGRVERISVYPSEFGKERMQQEELEGPPKELFRKRVGSDSDVDSDSDSDDDEESDEKIRKELLQEGDDQDFDSDALRSYQLDRLRYYYAVMTCSSPEVAEKIYKATDGTEYQSSSNFLDLRFVPDDVTFDDTPRDECTKVPDSYKPVEFVTNALQSSKVKLTWDMHPEEASRKESIKRAFSGSRNEIEENDLKAYLASDSEDEDDDGDVEPERPEPGVDEEAAPVLSKKDLARRKMREALGLSEEKSSRKGAKDAIPVGDMEVTFAPALSENKAKDSGSKEETTIEKYMRKERERKEKKRQKSKAKRTDADGEVDGDDDNSEAGDVAAAVAGDNDLGFDDPFFTSGDPSAAQPPSKTSLRKEERLKKRAAREAADAETAAQTALLAKALDQDPSASSSAAAHLDHFNMDDIARAEKLKNKTGLKSKKKKLQQQQVAADKAAGLQDGFSMDVGDDRFKAVFENHEYAIDPSNPKFQGTEGMKKLLEEGRRKRKVGDEGEEDGPAARPVKGGKRRR